jgi:Tol biopolymer transport system component
VAAAKSAKPRKLGIPSEDVCALAVSRQGNRLAYAVPQYRLGIWRVDLRDPDRKPGTPFKLISSTRNDNCPAYSPDGKRIAFTSDRSGSFEIWVCNSDGSNAVQFTSFGRGGAIGPRWSPDGRNIVFGEEFRDSIDIYVVSATGGPLRNVTSDQSGVTPWPFWSRDGKSIYFRSKRSGSSAIWKMPATGGDAVQMTSNGHVCDQPQESPDGKYLYYTNCYRYPEQCGVWRLPAGGGEEAEVLGSTACDFPYALREQGIYFFTRADEKGQSDIRFYDFATRRITKILTVGRQVSNIEVSPDGRAIVYAQNDQSGSDLMLVENSR